MRRYDAPRPLQLWIARVNPRHPHVRFFATEPADFRADDDLSNDAFETRCQNTLEFAQQYGVQLAINTAAFGPFRGWAGQPMNVHGLALTRGQRVSEYEPSYGGLFIGRDNRVSLKMSAPRTDGRAQREASSPSVSSRPSEQTFDDDALSGVSGSTSAEAPPWIVAPGFRMLLDEGQIVIAPHEARSGFGGLNPRTAVGTDAAGETLWIVVADGRQPDYSMGLTLVELACLFQSLGCHDALNLDGGGSSTLVVQSAHGAHAVLNTPLNNKTRGVLRQVAHNLGIYLPVAAGGPPAGGNPGEAATNDSPGAPGSPSQSPLYRFTESDLDAYLPVLRATMPSLPHRIVHLARKNLGQPYEIFLLGEFPFEWHDPDPLYNLAKSDCLTHAEHIYAAALADGFWSYLQNLQRLRYRDGMIGMVTRNHYTEADWNINNGFLFEDITGTLGGGLMDVPLRSTIQRAKFFAQFGIGQDIPDQPFRDCYIPKNCVPEILAELRDGDFINIVRGDGKEQYVGHVGIITTMWDRFPTGHDFRGVGAQRPPSVNLLHSARPVVQEEPLTYLADDARCLGIKVLRLRADAEERMEQACASSAFRAQFEFNPLISEPPMRKFPYHGQRLQSLRLSHDEPLNVELQQALESADREICAELGIAPEQRAFGVVNPNDFRTAMIRPDAMFYGASVPKIAILLAYFEQDPSRAESIPADVKRELELMIKRSSNEKAAKYSQLVGLDFIQKTLRSDKYRFYDEKTGGGIWCGKHYGIDQPRIGDPIADHSHAVTIRQCLRFYLMMEQGRLVNANVCNKIRELFSAPDVQFHNDRFVLGLNGRDVRMIRKSGEWENWHLDTASVRAADRTYVICGATHHERGREYLAQMATRVDQMLSGSPAPPGRRPTHSVYSLERPDPELMQSPESSGASLIFPALDTTPFNEALLSCNVLPEASDRFVFELRVGRRAEDFWSPWLTLGAMAGGQPISGATEFDDGRIDVDFFRSASLFDRIQARVTGTPGVARDPAPLRHSFVTVSETLGVPDALNSAPPPSSYPWRCVRSDTAALSDRGCGALHAPLPSHRQSCRLPVPFLSQRSESPDIAGRICSPTSVAMVMTYRGVARPVAEVAEAAYDPVHDIYGNWPRNIQAAYSLGVPGYLTRISDWHTAEQYIAEGQPLIVSVRWSQEGRLRNSPLKTTAGHLLVITGFDQDGMVHVNDPAAPDAATGQTKYYREDLEEVWMKATGGVTYVLLPPEK